MWVCRWPIMFGDMGLLSTALLVFADDRTKNVYQIVTYVKAVKEDCGRDYQTASEVP